jgi:hypothetical protein
MFFGIGVGSGASFVALLASAIWLGVDGASIEGVALAPDVTVTRDVFTLGARGTF